MFARIFSHCEITAFGRPTAFIFICHQIQVILTLSRTPKHLSYCVDFNRSRKHKTARECAAASTALRTPLSGETFHKALIKIDLTFQPQLFQAIRPIVLPSSRCPKTAALICCSQIGRKKFGRPGCNNPPHFHRLPIEIYSRGTACKSSVIHGRF